MLAPDLREARLVAGWLRAAGLGEILAARTCDEAIFLIGRALPNLLIIDQQIAAHAEERLLQHIRDNGHAASPALVRLIGETAADCVGSGRPAAAEVIRKPLSAHDVVLRVGAALQRSDLLGHLDRSRDIAAENLDSARRMQLGLLPTASQIRHVQQLCRVGVASFYRTGEEVGGDFWGVWPTTRRNFALAVVDFAGHGLGAALNTFRIHALFGERGLPRSQPGRMATLLNKRLHGTLPPGHFAAMSYLHIDAARREIGWCSAAAPPPLFVAADGTTTDLPGRGLPLGISLQSEYKTHVVPFTGSGVLAVFSDGLFESGPDAPEVPRSAMAEALAEPARAASAADLSVAAELGATRLRELRDGYANTNYSDDVVVVCLAFGPPSAPTA